MGYCPSSVFDYDSMVWCVSHAKALPRWQNVFKIYKDITIFIYLIILYYIIVILAYCNGVLENMPDDIYTMMLKVLKTVLNMDPKYNAKFTSTRMMYTIFMIAALLHYVTVISFYCVVIKISFDGHQIDSTTELIENRFQLAGDLEVYNAIQDSNQVYKYSIDL